MPARRTLNAGQLSHLARLAAGIRHAHDADREPAIQLALGAVRIYRSGGTRFDELVSALEVDLTNLADPGRALIPTAAILRDEIAQTFGLTELGQFTARRRAARGGSPP